MRRGPLWAAVGVLVAIALGLGVFLTLSGGDDGEEAGSDTSDATEPTDPTDAIDATDGSDVTGPTEAPASTAATAPATTSPPAPTAPATTVVATLPPTLPPASTLAPDPTRIDLGNGVAFRIPEGFTDTPSPSGSSHQLQNGIVNAFFQVLERTPGESPLVLLQEYVDTFDDAFDAVVYSQVIPSPTDTSGAAPADGNLVFYRALNADGTGVKGVIDANRRADGLSYVSDIFLAIDADTDNRFPDETLDELYESFLAAPLLGDPAPLTPPGFTRVRTVHAPYVIDGLVAVTPPAGWTVNAPGPGRVIMSRPDGQRFLGERIGGPITDMGTAQLAAQSTVLSLVPDATFGAFTTDEDTDWRFASARWGGTDPNTGDPLQGFISVWFHATTGEIYDSLEAWIGPATDPPSVLESEFLFQALDTSITRARG